jgi:hypothetical protein
MNESDDWSGVTWQANRLRQHRAFQALPFRDKVLRIEQLAETAKLVRAAALRAQAADEGKASSGAEPG